MPYSSVREKPASNGVTTSCLEAVTVGSPGDPGWALQVSGRLRGSSANLYLVVQKLRDVPRGVRKSVVRLRRTVHEELDLDGEVPAVPHPDGAVEPFAGYGEVPVA